MSRVENRESNDISVSLAHETIADTEPVKVLILRKGKMEEHVFTSSFLSSKLDNRNVAVNDLLESLQAIKHENRQLALKYEELKESYQLQKQMTWYWKRKAQMEEDNRQIFDAEESKKLETEHAEKKVSYKEEDFGECCCLLYYCCFILSIYPCFRVEFGNARTIVHALFIQSLTSDVMDRRNAISCFHLFRIHFHQFRKISETFRSANQKISEILFCFGDIIIVYFNVVRKKFSENSEPHFKLLR